MSRRSSAPRNQLLVDFSETDLNKLQGQYHRTEGAKRAYTKKTKGLIFRDKEEIERLQHEREEHLRSLRVSQSSFNRWTDASVVQDLTAKLACRDRIDEELEAEKAKVASLKDQGHKCFNEMMTRNGELREELKILQVERKQFLHVQSRLEKELHAIQKVISNLRTKCTEAFNASVNIQERQRMLTGQNDKDVTQYIKEKSNLEREMSRSRNFEAFLDIKAVARTHRRKVKYKQLESTELGQEDFEEAIKKILTETEESDLDKLVRNFIQMEEQNYTLLKFVNYQQSEAETIRRQISQLCKERAIFVAEEQRQQEQHQALRKKISIKQEEIEKQLGGYQHRVDVFEKLLDQLKDGVKSLLQISYESSVIQLVSSDGGEDENIVESLRRVENRVNELLALQSFLHFQENVEQWDIDSLSTIAVQLLGKNPPAVNLNTVAATSAPGDDPNVVESVLLEANGPVNRNDLLTLVNKRIQRRRKTD
ncbi:outer dynein arm-docking complex subunit 1-like isoform X2 [Centropristis striata]|uniref:outer dynein arm-docking complex subunit 1-like isoform X2 n=1 Tax=Centropristis striata TaxID=184440 RepID=UPI0027DF6A56|nr:outer dynein arm-docking complex subunit 1-like isoform X2 [Centropristis striata]